MSEVYSLPFQHHVLIYLLKNWLDHLSDTNRNRSVVVQKFIHLKIEAVHQNQMDPVTVFMFSFIGNEKHILSFTTDICIHCRHLTKYKHII